MKLEKIAAELTKAQAEGRSFVLHSYGRARDVRRTKCSWQVQVLNVDLEDRTVYASWNCNSPQWWAEHNATKWRKVSYWEAEKKKAAKKAEGK